MSRKREVPGRGPRSRPARPKLDPRLAYLLSLSSERLAALTNGEHEAIRELARKRRGGSARRRTTGEGPPDAGAFAPITAGAFLPASTGERRWPVDLKEPYVSAFLDAEASPQDLRRLGVRVRNQVCDIATAFIPLSAIPRLEASPAVRAIELARPLFPRLDQALPYARVDALQAGPPPTTGGNVVLGIVDTVLDVYHPDFSTGPGQSRVLFLWDQTLTPQAGETGPPVAPALPGFAPAGGTYGVEYSRASINVELGHPPGVPAYQTVRHGGAVAAHGTHVTGIAAGNGRGQAAPALVGGAPGANLVFVASASASRTDLFADSAFVADAFAYIFARAAALGQACVVNLSLGDEQGPHDGTTLGERFLDGLLATPGRAITIAAGNATGFGNHASGAVAAGPATDLVLRYRPPTAAQPHVSDDVEIWYDGHDRFSVTVTTPSGVAIGPILPGAAPLTQTLPGGVEVSLASVLNDPRNGDNLISMLIVVPPGQSITGDWRIALTGATVINGSFHAWLDRNNRPWGAWLPPFRDDAQLTIGVPATCRRAITVGNHTKAGPPPTISPTSGLGPSRDGRVKPEIATVGTGVTAPRSRDMLAADPGDLYTVMTGTSMAAPLVAGACALMFQCRGPATSWTNLLQMLEDTAGTGLAVPPAPPNRSFGFGFLQAATACTTPPRGVDVWLRDDPADTGGEPFTGPVAWLSPDIEVLDTAGNPVPNPRYHPTNRFNNIVRVTVRNRGTGTARNTEAYFYWADPATNLPFPPAWNASGIFTDPPSFTTQGNRIVIPEILPGGAASVQFAWAPPAPGSNLRGDDHFCLLVRLEHPEDPSQVGAGGWVIAQRNNLGLRNVHVLPNARGGEAATAFYVVGSAEHDSLVVSPDLAAGAVTLRLPVRALPWRDLRLAEKRGEPRLPYGRGGREDSLATVRATLEGPEIAARTGVGGAARLDLGDGIASILAAEKQALVLPCVHLVEGARLPVRLEVTRLDTDERRRFVHVAQLSAGRLVGGVTLELRKGLARARR